MPIKDVSNKSLPELISLRGRTAVVTGGASGIGFAISTRLAEAGATVIIGDLNEEAAKKAATDLSRFGVEHKAAQLDVSKSESITALADFAVSSTGRLDIWVNNAGVYPSKPVLEITDEEWDFVHDLNLRGTFIGSREASKRMIDLNIEGVVVNLVSTAAFNSSNGANPGHYVSSKHGVAGLTKSLAVELGKYGIRAVAVAPTLSETPGVAAKRKEDAGMDEALAAYAKTIPSGRLGVPDDVARVVLFAASDLAKFVNGSTVLADGGDVAK